MLLNLNYLLFKIVSDHQYFGLDISESFVGHSFKFEVCKYNAIANGFDKCLTTLTNLEKYPICIFGKKENNFKKIYPNTCTLTFQNIFHRNNVLIGICAP